jgi:hypothetical protein
MKISTLQSNLGYIGILLSLMILEPLQLFAHGGECLLVKVPLEQTISASKLVIEAKVVSKQSFWNQDKTMIYTRNELKIEEVLKGEIKEKTILLLTEGGVVGQDFLSVNPELSLTEGASGIFCLEPVQSSKLGKDKFWKTYARTQGFIAYSFEEMKAELPFESFDLSKDEAYLKIMGILHKEIKSDRIKPFGLSQLSKNAVPVGTLAISTFSPSSITAGTGSILTITGSGFGAIRGDSGRVEFSSADNVSSSTFVRPLVNNYVSWTDTEIRVKVPGVTISGTKVFGAAGTGPIRVKNNNGTIQTSASNLNILWSHVTLPLTNGVDELQFQLINDNGTGGYSWSYASNFTALPSAVTAFERAVNIWKCERGANFTFIPSGGAPNPASSIGSVVDEINTIVFDDATNSLGAGTLGVTYIKGFSACQGSAGIVNAYAKEIDIVFSRNASGLGWGFQEVNKPSGFTNDNKIDFMTVAFHELGHSLLLGHNRNAGTVMFPTADINFFNRNAAQADKDAMAAAFTKSAGAIPCVAGLGGYQTSSFPALTLSISTPNANACANNLVSFTAATTGFFSTFEWLKNGVVVSGQNGTSFSSPDFNPNEIITARANSCSVSSVTSAAISITGTKLSSALIPGPISGTTCVKIGNSSPFSLPAVSGATSYDWDNGTTYTGLGNSANLLFASSAYIGTPPSTQNVRVIAKNFCSQTAWSNSFVSRFTPNAPTAISGQIDGVCNSTKTYSVPAVTFASSYSWTIPTGASISGASNTNTVNVVFGTSSGSITAKANNGSCAGPAASLSVFASPKAPTSITGPTSARRGQSISYSVANPNNFSVVWQVRNTAGTVLQTIIGNPISYTIPSTFTIGATVSVCASFKNSSCASSPYTCKSLSILAASLDGSNGNQIFLSAYPNPASEQIRLNVNGLNTEENAVVKVRDLQGMEILNQDFDKSDISTQIDLDLRSVKPGVYLGTLQQGDKKSFFRFVKE